jgi:hypothetical protein
LASGGGSGALHLGDHRLRDGRNLHHQLAAQVENQAVFVDFAAGHLGEVVTGAEDASGGGQDHGADAAIAAEFVQAGDQLARHARG